MPYLPKDFDVQDATVRVVNWRNLKRIDWLLPILVVALAVIGWFVMYSASRSSDIAYFHKQVLIFFVGLVLVFFIVCIDYRFVVAIAPVLYVGALLMLLAVLAVGTKAKGSERWLSLGFVNIQPSEFAKVVMIYSLTWYLSTVGERIKSIHWFVLTFVIVLVPMALILKQPNLGTAACMGPLALAMLYVAGCRLWHLVAVLLVGLSVVPVLWLEMKDFTPPKKVTRAEKEQEKDLPKKHFYDLKDYQKSRIYTFLHPDFDPAGSGWHTTQSLITVGSGGLSGKGYLKGTQTRLNYLPEHHTDFIFSMLAEEEGFIGAAVVIGLFTAFLLRGLMYARDCPEMMGTLLATGVVTVLAFHIFVNIAITVGLMPVTGIPLPFLSYGRSFYVTTMICVGILLNVPMRRRVFTA